MPVHEYLHTAYRPDVDYVDGRLVERHVGEKSHGKLQTAVWLWFHVRKGELDLLPFVEQRVQIHSTRYRVPDVCVLRGPEPDTEVFHDPPLLCVEVLSKDDTIHSMQEKIDDYLGFGVSAVWLIDPWSRRAWIHTRDAQQEVRDGILRVAEVQVPLAELFS